MDEQRVGIRRRLGLSWGGSLLIGAGITLLAGRSQAAKADKRDFSYQDKPREGKSCKSCRLYLPGEAASGQCAVVAGDISPNGWCMAYSQHD